MKSLFNAHRLSNKVSAPVKPIRIYRGLHKQVLTDIANENLCFLKLVNKGVTTTGRKYHEYDIGTIGLPHYPFIVRKEFFRWLRDEAPKFG